MITSDYVKQHPELWKFIFCPHHHYGWLNDFHRVAMKTCYPFFIWNDVVYSTLNGEALRNEFPLQDYLD